MSSDQWKFVLLISICFVESSVGLSEFCDGKFKTSTSCTTQILGQELTDDDSCKLEILPGNSSECQRMEFSPFQSNEIGSIILKPFVYLQGAGSDKSNFVANYTILNITFTNIKWKTIKFRFLSDKYKTSNHCRNIVIASNVTINDQSILYYDCYKYITDGMYGINHKFDFEARDDNVVNRGRYNFYMPTDMMLSDSINETYWRPFIYIEMLPEKMRLHIAPPPPKVNINAYKIQVVLDCKRDSSCENIIKENIIKLVDKNSDKEVIYDYEYSYFRPREYVYFKVIPLHDGCKNDHNKCQSVESPKNLIDIEQQTLSICIASLCALIVSILFAYYIALLAIRKYYCKDKYFPANLNEIPAPTKVLVVYSPTNRLHAKCVESFVSYLRSEYGLDVMYDGDIVFTTHKDPQIWANDVFSKASHMIYVVGPANETNVYNNIYNGSVNPYRNLDSLLLSYLKHARASKRPKDVMNVLFDHSTARIPEETKYDRKFVLLDDWLKLIENLSKYMPPQKKIMRTEKGRCFIEDLKSAKKLLVDSGLQNV